MKSIFFKKIPVLYFLVLFIATILATFLITQSFAATKLEETIATNTSNSHCSVNVRRLNGFQFIKPIMFYDDECPSDRMATINQSITNIIDNYIKTQNVTTASVYLRDYQYNDWIAVNDEVTYEPGSLFKVPLLIAFLRMNEEHPGTLDKQITYNHSFAINKDIAFKSKQIQLGKSYTVRELLNYMIVNSDNNATALLQTKLDLKMVYKMFSDLGLEVPSVQSQNYYFTAKQYSLFMRAIYNASYLNKQNSEYAAELLSKTDFKEGIQKGIPANVKLAHKFGEAGNPQELQLHESAIIYLNNKPYLLTVMTKGKDNKTLAQLIAQISTTVYQEMLAESTSS
jgi:beta-lactamase class A